MGSGNEHFEQSPNLARLLTEREVAEILSISVKTLRNWRVSGGPLPHVKISRMVRYKSSVTAKEIEQHDGFRRTFNDGEKPTLLVKSSWLKACYPKDVRKRLFALCIERGMMTERGRSHDTQTHQEKLGGQTDRGIPDKDELRHDSVSPPEMNSADQDSSDGRELFEEPLRSTGAE